MSEDQLSDEELAEKLSSILGNPQASDDKQNLFTFLTKVIMHNDTTKLGYLKEEEIGMPVLPLRTYKDLALFCREVADMDYYGIYFEKKGEILTSTSLSRDAKLLNLSVMQKRELFAKEGTIPRKENKGWFKKKEPPQTEVT